MNEVTYMTIGAKIKKLRRERDMTQEDLAEALGISAASVSQWECDKTAPDISQLPVLSNIFEVTTDFLLGVDVANKEKEIDAILETAYKHHSAGHAERAVPILEDALKKYPTSHKIMYRLSSAYSACVRQLEIVDDEDTRTHYRNEVIRLCEKIRAESTDDQLRLHCSQLLCYTYEALGMTDKIRELAKGQADLWICSEDYMICASKGVERFLRRRNFVMSMVDFIRQQLERIQYSRNDDGSMMFSVEERIEIMKKIPAMFKLFIDDGNYGFYEERMALNGIELSELYAAAGDCENTLSCLESAAVWAVHTDTEYDPDGTYTALLLRGKRFGGVSFNSQKNLCAQILDELNESVFDFVREKPRFTAVIEQLKPHAAER